MEGDILNPNFPHTGKKLSEILLTYGIVKSSILSNCFNLLSSYLVSKLNGTFFNSNCKLASLDVVSLFTMLMLLCNVPHEWVYESISKRWDLISRNTQIPKEKFLLTIKLILNSTFFLLIKLSTSKFLIRQWVPLLLIISDLVL